MTTEHGGSRIRRIVPTSPLVHAGFWWAVLAASMIILLTRPGTWFDLHWVYLGAQNFVHHRPPYVVPGLDAIPSTLLYAAPLGLVDEVTARVIMRVVGVLCLVVAIYAALAVVTEHKPRLAWVASTTAAFVVFDPARALIRQGNIGVVATALVCVALLCAARDRWDAYGVVLGVALSVKPVAVALVLLPLLYRRPRAALTAAVIPLALAGVGLAASAHPTLFFTHLMPYYMHSAPERAFSHGSIYNLLTWYGAPTPLTTAARLLAVTVMLWAAVARHRMAGPEGLRIAETSGCLVLATLLVTSTTLNHYLLFALPLLVGIVVQGSVMRSPPALIGLVLICSPFRWGFTPLSGHIHEGTVVWAIGMILIAAALAWRSFRPSPDRTRTAYWAAADEPQELTASLSS